MKNTTAFFITRFFVLYFLLLSIETYGQIDWILTNSFQISSWEQPLTDEEKRILLTQTDFTHLEDWLKSAGTSLDQELNQFHFGHFNTDNELDLIVVGYFGSEALSSHVFLFDRGSFKSLIIVGIIDRLEYESFEIPSIVSNYPPCCADVVHGIQISRPKSNMHYKSSPFYYFNKGTIIPEVNVEGEKFTVLNSPYHLRKSPEIDNEFHGEYENVGNITHSYSKGDSGLAYYTKSDSTGREWWFVKMTNPRPTSNKHFPEENSFYLGWMSSRYLKKE